ncbi:uncharacterized protein PgNI_01224, partial [Pyricularia grisea]|uniref:Uncharacterized protein n=1 Tax=Pyricularia grisea TaxID=148305 RepID=A0A6P8BFY5_PYRGI
MQSNANASLEKKLNLGRTRVVCAFFFVQTSRSFVLPSDQNMHNTPNELRQGKPVLFFWSQSWSTFVSLCLCLVSMLEGAPRMQDRPLISDFAFGTALFVPFPIVQCALFLYLTCFLTGH